VLLAEQHHGLAEGIRSLLGTKFEAVVMVADELSLIEAAERLNPGLAVVDHSLAMGDFAGLIDRLRRRTPGLRVIVLSIHEEPTVAQSAFEAGADGFLVKSSLAVELIPAIETVLNGGRYASRTSRK
jgi:DNA-binding NarL/FixJ family response regulator